MNYTSLEHSKKLLELGLSPDSADMHYYSFRRKDDVLVWTPELGKTSKYDIPCWSIGALLDIMPSKIKDGFLTLFKKTNESGDEYCCCYNDCNGNSIHHFFGDTAIDACYNMMIWLL